MHNNTIIKVAGLCSALMSVPLSAGAMVCQAPAANSGWHAPRERGGEGLKPGRPEAYTRGITGGAGYASGDQTSMPASVQEGGFRVATGRPEAFTRGITGGSGGESMGRGSLGGNASVIEETSITGRPEVFTRGICPFVERG